MEKILLALDATQINMNVLDFSCYIAKLTNSKLTAVFLENLEGDPVPALKMLYGMPYVETIVSEDIPGNKIRIKQCDDNIQLFEAACKNRGVKYTIHREAGEPVATITNETRFADLLIANAEMSFAKKYEGTPTDFIKELLAKSECPVIISPFSFNTIDEIVFAYDGTPSSVFAIKQFTYLFPQLTDKKATIVQVNEKEDGPVIEKAKMTELLKIHYSNIGFHQLHGKAGDEIFSFLLKKKNAFVVMGAFGRGLFLGLLKRSTADLVVKTVNLPVFIAHH